ncbi:MAG: hypothetical protein PHT80_15510 [Lentisphaeria bacterium]|nr:hypothetical protein [Lentisphaeria bacterium]
MKNWLYIHRLLFGVAVATIGLQLLVYILVLRPQKNEIAEQRAGIVKKRQRLTGTEWPLQAEILNKYHSALVAKLEGPDGIQAHSTQLMRRAAVTFQGRIARNHEHAVGFMRGVSRLDYQEEFNRVQRRAAGQGIYFSPEVLNLAEDTAIQHIYQALLQIWALDSLLDIVQASGMSIAKHPQLFSVIDGVKHPAALVAMQPMQAYFADTKAEKPYLLEFPVRLTLVGQQEQFMAFLQSLDSDQVFMPVRNFECQLRPPKAGELAQLHIDITCAAFFVLEDKSGPRQRQ